MFPCSKCQALGSEVVFLREQLKAMTDRLVALANPNAYQLVNQPAYNPDDYYGSSSKDQYVEYGEMGEPVLMEKFVEIKS